MAYKHQLNNSNDIPPLNDFQHSINLSTIAGMESDFENIISSLQHRGYNPDVYITLSENVFDTINYVSLVVLLRGVIIRENLYYLKAKILYIIINNFLAYITRVNECRYTNLFSCQSV